MRRMIFAMVAMLGAATSARADGRDCRDGRGHGNDTPWVSAVPEPWSLVMAGVGIGCLTGTYLISRCWKDS